MSRKTSGNFHEIGAARTDFLSRSASNTLDMLIKTLVLAFALFVSTTALFAQQRFQITHNRSIYHIKFSPSGLLLISFSGNQDMALWEVSTGRVLWKRPISFIQKSDEHFTLNAIAWSPDEKLIATGSANGTVQLWNANDGAFLWRTDAAKSGISAVAFSPDGKTVAATSLGTEAGLAATLISVASGQKVTELMGNRCAAMGIAFDLSGNELSIGNLDGNVARWNLLTDKPINAAECRGKVAYGGERSLSEDLGLSVRRTTVGQVVIEKSDGEVIKTLELNNSKLWSVINSRAQKAVVAEYGSYHIYDLASGSEKKLNDCVSGHAFDLSNDGKHFAQSCDGFQTSIRLTDLSSDRSWLLDGHPSKVNAIAFSPDFSLLAIAGNDGNAYLFDPKTRFLKQTLDGDGSRLTALTFGPDSKTMLTGDENGVLRRWDLSTGAMLDHQKLTEGSNDLDKIEVSANGKELLVISRSEAILISSDLKAIGALRTAEGYSSTAGDMTIGYSSVPIVGAAFLADDKYLITGHPDGTIRLWDRATTRQTRKFKIAEAIRFVAPLKTGRAITLATVGGKTRFQLVSTTDGRIIRQSRPLDDAYPEKMAVSPDGRFAAFTDIIGGMVICSLDTMALRDVDNGLSGSDSVAFDRDANSFFIGGENQNMSVYDTQTLKKQWSLISSFMPSAAETRLTEERNLLVAKIGARKKERENNAAAYVKAYRDKVFVTFEHYGDMSDPGQKRMFESGDPKESSTKKPASESNAVWLRLHNDSTLPIQIPTLSSYFMAAKCVFEYPDGEKLSGLCKDREIDVWFGVKDTRGKWVPYGFDFGSSTILLPKSSVLFSVPLSLWERPYSIVFDFSFQNVRSSENDRKMDYGKKVEIKFSKLSLPAH